MTNTRELSERTPEVFVVSTRDGHRFEARQFSADSPDAPLVIFLAAMGVPARAYARFAQTMASAGVGICVADWRGLASSSVRPSRQVDFSYRELLEYDVAALLDAVRQRASPGTLWLGGHSLGGQLGLLAASQNSDLTQRLLLIASGTVHLPFYDARLRFGIRSMSLLAAGLSPLLGYFPGERIGFGGNQAAGVMRDWSQVARSGQYRPSGSTIDYERALSQTQIKGLAVNFAADAWAPPEATSALLEKLAVTSRQQFTHWIWDKSHTGGLPLDHLSWLKSPQHVAPEVARHVLRSSAQ